MKLHGHRIEIGEIEAALRAEPGVRDAAVALRGQGEAKRLVGYVVGEAAPEQLRQALAQRLPAPMVPATIIMLDALPLTPNGKLSRNDLPEEGTHRRAVPPRSWMEKKLAALWSELLQRRSVAASDDFFELGGHSLSIMQLAGRLQQGLGREVPLALLFTHPVLSDMAVALEQAGPVTTSAILPRPAGRTSLPLSYEQERLFYLWRLSPMDGGYVISGAVRLSGSLDVGVLRSALGAVVSRHESLRTRFIERDGVAQQVVDGDAAPGWSEAALDEAALAGWMAREASAPFDLERGPVFRAALARLGAQEHVLLLSMHHIVSDGWSIGVLLREVSACYAAGLRGEAPALPALPVQYGDYAVWQREWWDEAALAPQLAYWRDRLGDEHPVLELPLDRPRRAAREAAGGRVTRQLSASLTRELHGLAQRHGATLFMVLLAGLQAVLHRYSGQADQRIGVPVANRRRLETEGLIGFFVNTLVIRAELSGRMGFETLLGQMRARVLEAQAHQDLPFGRLVEGLRLPRSLSHTPLFQVMFNLQQGEEGTLSLPGLTVSGVETGREAAQFDLVLNATELSSGVRLGFDYARDLFDEATIERLAGHYEALLAAVARTADVAIGAVALEDVEAPAPLASYAFEPVVDRVLARAAAAPEREAIACEGERLSYGALAAWSGRIAWRLSGLGVSADERVGLCVTRGPGMIAAMLGILRSGGAYVPLDPAYPPDRLRLMIEDAGLRRVVTDAPTAAALAEVLAGCELVLIEEVGEAPPQDWRVSIHPDQLAYVIYTSGSTGRPKGVAISHGALNLHLGDFLGRYGIAEDDVVLHTSTINFDVALHEILPVLIRGGRLVMRGAQAWDLSTLTDTLRREAVTFGRIPTAYWQQWLHDLPSDLPALRQVTVGGEALAGDALRRWQAAPLAHVALDNLYGPTETTVAALGRRTTPADADAVIVPIGEAWPGRRAIVLDADGHGVPAGGLGELCLGGESLARGYVDRPGLTAERFVPDPRGGGGRLYRTGDLCRQRLDGTVEFLGRLDQQVKLRGHRIELGEIEAALRAAPGVRDAVVVLRGEGESRHLVAYAAGEADGTALRRTLEAQLPGYMVPALVMVLPSLPVMPNGKLARAALPEPALAADRESVAPRTPAEAQLLSIWQSVLRRDDLGVTDNFFEMGGDSILSLQIIARAREAGLQLTPRQLFEHPTIEAAAAIAAAPAAPAGSVAAGAEAPLPLTPIQRYFFEAHPEGPAHWNQAVLLRAAMPLRADLVRQALHALIQRHDALRLRFTRTDGGWQQHRGEEGDLSFASLDLRGRRDWREAMEAEANRLQRSLDLASGRLLTAGCFQLEGEARLLLAIHHLVVDGVSWRVLIEEFQQAYAQLAGGESLALPALTTRWADWTVALAARAQQPALQAERAWWLRFLAGADGTLPLEGHQQADRRLSASQVITWQLDAVATRRLLQDVPRAYRLRTDEVLLTALVRVLSRWTGREGVLIDLEGHGREEIEAGLDLSRTIGWFTTRYPVWLKAPSEAGAAMIAVKEALRAIPSKGLHWGLLGEASAPQAWVSFNYLGRFDQSLAQDGPWGFAMEGVGQSMSLDSPLSHALDLNGSVRNGVLTLGWRYSPGELSAATVQGLSEAFARELDALIAHCVTARPRVTASDFPLAGLDQATLEALDLPLEQVKDIYPATPMQQGLLFHASATTGLGVYVNQRRLTLEGPLDAAMLRQAWEASVARHDILRTGFHWRHGGTPLQVVRRKAVLPFLEEDWRERKDYETRLAGWRQAEVARGFDLATAPLMRVALFRRPDGAHDLIWTNHHLITDGWSSARLLGEIVQRYRAASRGEAATLPPPAPYRGYVAWLAQRPSAESWWRDQAARLPEPALLADAAAPPDQPASGEHRLEQRLDPVLHQRLQRAAQRHRVTLNTLVQAGWALTLARHIGRSCVGFGITVSGRPPALRGVGSC